MNSLPLLLISTLLFKGTGVDVGSEKAAEARALETNKIREKCARFSRFYEMPSGETYRDITQELLESPETASHIKTLIREQHRRIILFKYPSDGLEVKGYLSFTPDHKTAPLLLFLRGGNRIFGLKNPANSFSCINNYTTIATTYRGGVSEGADEFGGSDVNDVENVLKHLPQLEQELSISLKPTKKFILGESRGGMQMFLALARSSSLQGYFDKAVSLCGLLNLSLTLKNRQDMRTMLEQHYALNEAENKQEWVHRRNPLDHIASLKKKLPCLIIQGMDDTRIDLNHGREFYSRLKERGNLVDYWEIERANHCLTNCRDRIHMITEWLENPQHS